MAAAVNSIQSELLDCTAVSTEVNFNDTNIGESSLSDDTASEEADKSSVEDHDDTMNNDSLVKSDSEPKEDEDLQPEKNKKKTEVSEEKPRKKKAARKTREQLDTNAAERIKSTGSSRQRKKFEPFVAPASSPATKKVAAEIVPGKGVKLSDIPSVAEFIDKKVSSDPGLQMLHYFCFGGGQVKAFLIKKNLRNFSGYSFEEESSQFSTRKAHAIKKYGSPALKKICTTFGMSTPNQTKAQLVDTLMKFCLEPEGSQLKPMSPKSKSKKSPKAKVAAKRTKSGERTPKKTKGVGKKRKIIDSTEEESDVENQQSNLDDGVEPPSKRSRDSQSKSKVEKKHTPKKQQLSDKEDDSEPEGVSDDDESEPKSDNDSDYSGEKTKKKKSKKPAAKKGKSASKPKPKGKKAPEKRKPSKSSEEEDHDEASVDEDADASGLPSDGEIKNALKKILDTADLNTITMKMVLEQIRKKYSGVDLDPKKAFIKKFVNKVLEDGVDENSKK